MASHCKFWLPKKKRFCSKSPFGNSPFCGNHAERSDGRWISCPIDPSHCVLEGNVQSHLKKCPLLKQTQSLARQPFYKKGINTGRENEEEEEVSSTSDDEVAVTSEVKRNAVYAMSIPTFLELVAKIKSFHASLCNCIRDSYKIPEACSIWTNREVDKYLIYIAGLYVLVYELDLQFYGVFLRYRKLPFKEKHVIQQASILGNLEEFGVLKKDLLGTTIASKQGGTTKEPVMDPNASAVVEFGAGRGYLTQVLADCYGIKKVVLVERKSYKLKADRSLRQKEGLEIERLRIDIEDLDLYAVESLHGGSYIAIGKHLCGVATDVTLRCCFRQPLNESSSAQSQGCCRATGLAIATCCHHLCQWKSYTNKRFMSDIGFSREDFHAISWFTSWAVDSDHGSEFSSADCSIPLEMMIGKKELMVEPDWVVVDDIVRNMDAIDRALLGHMCKDIIDAGRLMWLREKGLRCELVKYVPFSVSPENRLLVASP